jgi:hypothetical protein
METARQAESFISNAVQDMNRHGLPSVIPSVSPGDYQTMAKIATHQAQSIPPVPTVLNTPDAHPIVLSIDA